MSFQQLSLGLLEWLVIAGIFLGGYAARYAPKVAYFNNGDVADSVPPLEVGHLRRCHGGRFFRRHACLPGTCHTRSH